MARLVETRREGTHVVYRLAGTGVIRLLRELEALGHERLAEVRQVVELYINRRDALEPVSIPELRRRIREGEVTLLDVRPADEYAAGHIPGALSIPLAQLRRRLAELPKHREIVAYCRGPYCVYSVEAVGLLRRQGFRARRADEGVSGWRARGFPLAAARAG